MIKLTADDHARMYAAIWAHQRAGGGAGTEWDDAIYRAGLAAGIERAAKVCDEWRRTEIRDPCCDQAQHDALNSCAAAIRALLTAS
jgi:hypothetical protein